MAELWLLSSPPAPRAPTIVINPSQWSEAIDKWTKSSNSFGVLNVWIQEYLYRKGSRLRCVQCRFDMGVWLVQSFSVCHNSDL
jgi:hypothetical protein